MRHDLYIKLLLSTAKLTRRDSTCSLLYDSEIVAFIAFRHCGFGFRSLEWPNMRTSLRTPGCVDVIPRYSVCACSVLYYFLPVAS